MTPVRRSWTHLFSRTACLCLAAGALYTAQGESRIHRNPLDVLDQFSESSRELASRVAPSVVQVLVTRFGPREGSGNGRTGVVVERQQSIGSGVIIDPDGYIVTNAHVVSNAQRIRVSLVPKPTPQEAAEAGQSIKSALAQSFATAREATLVGVFREADLALLKIADTGLPALPFADYTKLRQGQLVFAFGSREGLHNSVSMGIVSSVARQPDPDTPFIYIQTDAPINPGDSGGPLVNTAGEIVGLNTFILSQSGGSEGLGFAIPSDLIQLVSAQLRKHGHFHRQVMGIGVQSITTVLASALHLPQESGVVVSDVLPGSPAESAGIKLNDIILAVDRKPVSNLPMFTMSLLTHSRAPSVTLELLRGCQRLTLDVPTTEEEHRSDRLIDFIEAEKSQVPRLGIVGVGIDKQTGAMFPNLRGFYGVFVAARSSVPVENPSGLQTGDVIHEVNGVMVSNVEALREAIDPLKRGAPVALFIERDGKLQYLSFEME